jgi:hypothetical protein
MPDYLTFARLSQLQATKYFSESDMRLRATKEGKNIFLSYSSKDKNYLPGVIKLLEDHGGAIYVDEGDARLPKKPSKETAAILRDTIQRLKRFVLFVTTNSKDSIWIPWELGLGDAYKSLSSVALLPTVESAYQQEWVEQEYLGLYRRIVWGRIEGEIESCWMVYDHHENTAQKLSTWIKGY